MKKKTYSEKVEASIQRMKIKKVKVYSALEMTQQTFWNRIQNNNWRIDEIEILNKFLKIKN